MIDGTFDPRLSAIVNDLSYKDWTFILGKDGIGLYFLQCELAAAPSCAHDDREERQRWELRTGKLRVGNQSCTGRKSASLGKRQPRSSAPAA
jgi:hypothetical protein